jgi:hypothetical protein
MKTIKRLLSLTLVLAVAAGYAPGTPANASSASWVETFATVSGTQYQAGSVMNLDYGVQNHSASTQDIVLVGVIRFSDNSMVVAQPREPMTLLSGDGVIRFGYFILPQNAPLGPAEFIVGAYVRGPAPGLQGPRVVYDSDTFTVVP